MIRRLNVLPYLLVLPSVMVIGLLLVYPIGRAVWLSLYDLDLLRPARGAVFVGLGNYADMLGRSQFWRACWATLIYTAGTVVGSYVIGLASALLVNQRFYGRAVARSILIVPWAVPYVVVTLIWSWMLEPEFGVVNFLLTHTHLLSHKVQWLTHPSIAMLSVLIVTVWSQYPFATVMLLAGLQTIPRELYEAAAIDGGGSLSRFWHITRPGLAPVALVVNLLLVIWSFRRFTIIFVMTGGGPARSTETIVIQTYLEAFRNFSMGYAAALGVMTLLVSLVFSACYLLVQHRQAQEGAG